MTTQSELGDAREPDQDYLQVRLYRQPVPRFWWLRRRSYLLFILRELSSAFVAWFIAYLLVLVYAVGQGESSYQRFLDWSANPFLIALNVVTLAFVVLHAVTFFQAAPQTTVVRLRGRRVPTAALAAPIFAAWVVVSAFLIWLVVLA
jgi:fumarate reductase subunit C